MNDRRKFRLWQAKWLLKGVLGGHTGPREAIRRYRNTRFIGAYTVGNPPPPGDVVWSSFNGHDMRIIGRQIIPKDGDEGTVIL